MQKVYVLNKDGNPLMPCSPAKARRLLDNSKAKVKQRTPFTIQLVYGSAGYRQSIILGVDAGSKTVGLSAGTHEEELFAANVILRNDVVKLLSTRREFRKVRRSRKTRYRQPRFNNRIHSKYKGWIAPSVYVKITEHITAIRRVCSLLPVSKVIVETAEFDLQRMKAIQDSKSVPVGLDYQRGEMYGYYNVRQYVLKRDRYTCQYCKKRPNVNCDVKFHVHHIESRKVGGNAPDNLITLCSICHAMLHKGLISEKTFVNRRRHSTRDATFMGIMRKTLLQKLRLDIDIPVVETKGYITKATRVEIFNLSKSHVNDAFSIVYGIMGFNRISNYPIERTDRIYTIKPVRHHNRQLHKATVLKGGVRKNNQAPVYVKNFRLFDKVLFRGMECFVWGRRVTGYFLLRSITGEKIKDQVNAKYLKLLERSSSYLIN